jgi:hypothetical protein
MSPNDSNKTIKRQRKYRYIILRINSEHLCMQVFKYIQMSLVVFFDYNGSTLKHFNRNNEIARELQPISMCCTGI